MENEQLLQALSEMMDRKLEPIKNDIEQMKSQMSALKAGQMDLRKDIKRVDVKVSDTYDLALEVWGTSTENRTWLEGSKLPITSK